MLALWSTLPAHAEYTFASCTRETTGVFNNDFNPDNGARQPNSSNDSATFHFLSSFELTAFDSLINNDQNSSTLWWANIYHNGTIIATSSVETGDTLPGLSTSTLARWDFSPSVAIASGTEYQLTVQKNSGANPPTNYLLYNPPGTKAFLNSLCTGMAFSGNDYPAAGYPSAFNYGHFYGDTPVQVIDATFAQRQTGTTSTIPEGGTLASSSITFSAIVTGFQDAGARLDVEVRKFSEAFTGAEDGGIATSSFVTSGNTASVIVSGLDHSYAYHIRYRAVDASNNSSTWREFDTAGNADFFVENPGEDDPELVNTFTGTSVGSFDLSLQGVTIGNVASDFTVHENYHIDYMEFDFGTNRPDRITLRIGPDVEDAVTFATSSDAELIAPNFYRYTFLGGATLEADTEYFYQPDGNFVASAYQRMDGVSDHFEIAVTSSVNVFGYRTNPPSDGWGSYAGVFLSGGGDVRWYGEVLSAGAPVVSNLQQFKSDGVTSISEGSTTTEDALVFQAVLSSSTHPLWLEVEYTTGTFSGIPRASSSPVSPSSTATTSVTGLADGSYKWRARAVDASTTIASEWVEFGAGGNADFSIHQVPLYTQIRSTANPESSTWFDKQYANGLGNTGPLDERCGESIGECGCALTAAVMLLRYYGVTAVDGQNVNPLTLNAWLSTTTGGYVGNGNVYWPKIAEYSRIPSPSGGVTYVGITNLGNGTTAEDLADVVTDYANSGKPVIIWSESLGHFVISNEHLADTYGIRDPLFYSTRTLNSGVTDHSLNIHNYSNEISGVRLFKRGNGLAAGAIALNLASPAELLVTDALGRRLGRDPVSSTTYDEIPNGFYGEDGIGNASSGTSEIHKTKNIWIADATSSSYNVRVIGTGSGSYTLTSVAYDASSTPHSEILSGETATDLVASYTLDFIPEEPEDIAITPVDADPPVITHSAIGSQYYQGTSSITFTFSAEDSGIGLVSATATLDGVPFTSGAQISFSNVGPHMLVISARDYVGNVATEQIVYNVLGLTPFTPEADTYLKQGTPNKNQGDEDVLNLQQSGKHRTLVRFSQSALQSAIPASSTIRSATLGLTITDNGDNWGTTGRTIDLHRMTASWTEMGVTWNCPNDTSTANSSPDCSPTWNMDSATYWPFVALPSATTTITRGLSGTIQLDVTDDVAGFLSGSLQNYGWLLKKEDEGAAGLIEFSSKEGEHAPKLMVTYE